MSPIRRVSHSPSIVEEELIKRQVNFVPAVTPQGPESPSATPLVLTPHCHKTNSCNGFMATSPVASVPDGTFAATDAADTSPTSVPSSKTASSTHSTAMAPGAVAGIIIAIIVLLSLVAAGFFLFLRRRRANRIAPSTAYIRSQRARAVAAATRGAIGGPSNFRKTNLDNPFMSAEEAAEQAPPPPFTSGGFTGSLAEKPF